MEVSPSLEANSHSLSQEIPRILWKLKFQYRGPHILLLYDLGWSGVRVPVEAGNFSPHHRVQTGSGAHNPTS
jgi:hypothetical protein